MTCLRLASALVALALGCGEPAAAPREPQGPLASDVVAWTHPFVHEPASEPDLDEAALRSLLTVANAAGAAACTALGATTGLLDHQQLTLPELPRSAS